MAGRHLKVADMRSDAETAVADMTARFDDVMAGVVDVAAGINDVIAGVVRVTAGIDAGCSLLGLRAQI